ncbi:unnamed protein product [Closterium sp. Naga37s-1]|nr:unnamed protein product [Closterium sp. Naga37s-1]
MPAQSAESAGRGSSEAGLSEGGISEGGLPSGGGYSGLAAPAREEELESLEEFRVVGKGGKVKGGDKGEPVELETRGVQGLAEEEGAAARAEQERGDLAGEKEKAGAEKKERAGMERKGGAGAEQEKIAGLEGKEEGKQWAGAKLEEGAGEVPGAESVPMGGVDTGEVSSGRTGTRGTEGGIEAQETAGWQAERGGEEVRRLEEGLGKMALGEGRAQQGLGEGAGGKGMRGVEEGLQRLSVSDIGGMRGRGGEGEKTVEGAQGEKAGKVMEEGKGGEGGKIMEKGKGGEAGVSGTPERQQHVEGVEQGMRRLAMSAQGGETGGEAGKVMEEGKGGEGGASGAPEGQPEVEAVEQGMRRLAMSGQGGESGGKERKEGGNEGGGVEVGEAEGGGGVVAGGGVVERAQDVATSAWTSTTGAITDTVKVLGSLTGFAPTSTEVPANAARSSGAGGTGDRGICVFKRSGMCRTGAAGVINVVGVQGLLWHGRWERFDGCDAGGVISCGVCSQGVIGCGCDLVWAALFVV